MPLVTVAIPVFNTAPYLRGCLESVLAQTLGDIEVICIDDASTDGSGSILDEFAARDPRLRITHLPENRGQAYCRNLALRHAGGTYLYFLDSDDAIEPHALQTLASRAKEQSLDIVFFDATTFYETESLRQSSPMRTDARTGSYPADPVSGCDLFDCFMRQGEWLVYVQREFLRTAFLRESGIGFPACPLHEDELFSFKAAVLARRALYLPERLLRRQVRARSLTTSQNMLTSLSGYAHVFREMSEFMHDALVVLPEYATANLVHIYEMARIRYAELSDSERKAIALGTQLAADLDFLEGAAEVRERYRAILRQAFAPLAAYEAVAIYGAGKVARSLHDKLSEVGIRTSRHVVSSNDGRQEILRGAPICEADAFKPGVAEALVVAMGEPARSEVSNALLKRGIPHWTYGENHLGGPVKPPLPQPIVTVVIPVFGVEAYLRETLDSVLAQTLADIEVICIDDAGTDACPQILDEYAVRDSRVRVFHLAENRRQGFGRNLGLIHAHGTFVYFLDADDAIEPNALETLVAICERDQLDGAYFDARSVFESAEYAQRFSHAMERRTGAYPNEAVSGPELFEAFCANDEWSVLVQRQIWRRAFLLAEGIAFPNDAEHEDQLFSITAALAAKRVRYVPEQLVRRRFRANSVVTTPPAPKNFHGYFTNAYKLIRFLRERNIASSPSVDYARHQLMRMALQQHHVFAEEREPLSWFARDGFEDPFLLFDLVLETQEVLRQEDRDLFAPLEAYDRIAIYGAGRVAQSVFERLCMLGLRIDEFVVTSREGNPEMLRHRIVHTLDEFEPAGDKVVLVAMAKERHAEVSELLSSRDIPHFLYAQNILTGPIG